MTISLILLLNPRDTISFLQSLIVILTLAPLGTYLLWLGLSSHDSYACFTEMDAEISADTLHPGESFTFAYRERARDSTDILWIGVFLIRRERVTVSTPNGYATRYDYDRLIQKIVHVGRGYERGETMGEKYLFTIPAYPLGPRNPHRHDSHAQLETIWLIKVRHNFGQYNDTWREYTIDVIEDSDVARISVVPSNNEETRYDVLFEENPRLGISIKELEIITDLLPHLDSTQVGDNYRGIDDQNRSLLMENVTLLEAQHAMSKLKLQGHTSKLEIQITRLGLPEMYESL